MTGHLLVIGAQRCGTSYLHRVLDEHPQVEMARPARPEPKFFSDPERYARGLTWYVRTFFGPGNGVRLRGDKSTSYLESPAAAQRAATVLGDAHVVAMLRDPLARAVSNWRFSTANKLEDRPLEQALADNLEAPRAWDAAATSVSPYAYLERGHYIDYLRPWARFGERLHVLFLEELAGDAGAVADLYAALGIDAAFRPPSLAVPANAGEGPAPAIDAGLRRRIRASFADSDRRLREWLGRPLPWEEQL